jgi:thioesterase domain-containing protein/acyl carrier protein
MNVSFAEQRQPDGKYDKRIELAAAKAPTVSEAAARSFIDSDGQPYTVLWLVADGHQEPDLAAVRDALRHRIPREAMPGIVLTIPALPKTRTGQIDKSRLLPPSRLAIPYRSVRYLTGATEYALTQIWERLLGVDELNIDEDFFDLGGSSRLAVSMLESCRQLFDVTVPPVEFLERPTVENLASLIEGRSATTGGCSLVTNRHAVKPPFFCVYPGLGIRGARNMAIADPERKFVNLVPPGYSGKNLEITSVAALSDVYIEEITRIAPQGPYHIGGNCASGLVAYEVARKLSERGQTVASVILLKTPVSVDLAKVAPTEFFVFDDLFVNAPAGSAASHLRAEFLRLEGTLKSEVTSKDALAELTPALNRLHHELVAAGSVAATITAERLVSMTSDWVQYVLAAARYQVEPAQSLPIELVVPHELSEQLAAAWEQALCHSIAVHGFSAYEPFESREFALWLCDFLDKREAGLTA